MKNTKSIDERQAQLDEKLLKYYTKNGAVAYARLSGRLGAVVSIIEGTLLCYNDDAELGAEIRRVMERQHNVAKSM